jgi:hypothetical protein
MVAAGKLISSWVRYGRESTSCLRLVLVGRRSGDGNQFTKPAMDAIGVLSKNLPVCPARSPQLNFWPRARMKNRWRSATILSIQSANVFRSEGRFPFFVSILTPTTQTPLSPILIAPGCGPRFFGRPLPIPEYPYFDPRVSCSVLTKMPFGIEIDGTRG